MSVLSVNGPRAGVSGRVPLLAVLVLAAVGGAAALFYLRPRWLISVVHPVAVLDCGLTDEGIATRVAIATGAVTSPTTPEQTDWGHIKTCLDNMAVNADRGERDHAMVPVSRGDGPPTTLGIEQHDTASILPRQNIWWDGYPDQTITGMHSARVMARVESRVGYNRLGFVPGNNYIVVWWNDTRVFMAVVNAQGAKRIGDPEPTFQPHGKVSGLVYDKSRDEPVPPNEISLPGKHNPDPMGGLSAAALECVKAHLKACFVDSSSEWKATPTSGFGIGMPVRAGSSQPWMACAMYGCCCGGRQCHT